MTSGDLVRCEGVTRRRQGRTGMRGPSLVCLEGEGEGHDSWVGTPLDLVSTRVAASNETLRLWGERVRCEGHTYGL